MTDQLYMVVRRDAHGTLVVMRRAKNTHEYAWDLPFPEALKEIREIKERQTALHNQDYAILGYKRGTKKSCLEEKKILIA